jgi:hypothetical protein
MIVFVVYHEISKMLSGAAASKVDPTHRLGTPNRSEKSLQSQQADLSSDFANQNKSYLIGYVRFGLTEFEI